MTRPRGPIPRPDRYQMGNATLEEIAAHMPGEDQIGPAPVNVRRLLARRRRQQSSSDDDGAKEGHAGHQGHTEQRVLARSATGESLSEAPPLGESLHDALAHPERLQRAEGDAAERLGRAEAELMAIKDIGLDDPFAEPVARVRDLYEAAATAVFDDSPECAKAMAKRLHVGEQLTTLLLEERSRMAAVRILADRAFMDARTIRTLRDSGARPFNLALWIDGWAPEPHPIQLRHDGTPVLPLRGADDQLLRARYVALFGLAAAIREDLESRDQDQRALRERVHQAERALRRVAKKMARADSSVVQAGRAAINMTREITRRAERSREQQEERREFAELFDRTEAHLVAVERQLAAADIAVQPAAIAQPLAPPPASPRAGTHSAGTKPAEASAEAAEAETSASRSGS